MKITELAERPTPDESMRRIERLTSDGSWVSWEWEGCVKAREVYRVQEPQGHYSPPFIATSGAYEMIQVGRTFWAVDGILIP